MIEKFKEKKSNEFCKELLDSLSIKDLLNCKNEINSEENSKFISDNNDNIYMEENQKNDGNENIFEEIQEFISFDKNNKNNKINNDNKKYNYYKLNDFIGQKYYINDYFNIFRYNNIPKSINNIKTFKQYPSDELGDLYDNYPPLLEKNPCDYYECQNNIRNIRNNFYRNNIYKKQLFQENNLFNYNKNYEVNSFLLDPQLQPNCLQKTIPLSYNYQSHLFSYNNTRYSPFFSSRIIDFDNYNEKINTFPALLKTIPNENNTFVNTFSFSNTLLNNKIKNQEKFKYSNNFNSIPEDKNIKEKNKKTKKVFIRNNKLVYVINEKHTDTKDVIYLDEDSESNKNDKNKKINKLDMIKEKLAEGRKQRSSKFRGVSKNGKHWQVLIMIKQKKRYIGNFNNEEEAAREYDKIAIQFHGPKAKTNFQYSEDEINSILAAPKLKKLSNFF